MNEKILFVDDEQRVLEGIKRALHRSYQLDIANSGAEAIEMVENHGPFALVVSDMRMPGMSGVELLTQLKQISPDTVRIMLTGNADQQTAIDAVNLGDIFRFLNKPCEAKLLVSTINAGLDQHRLITAEKVLLEKTLRGNIRALIEVLSLVNPEAFGRIGRLQNLMRKIGTEMKLPDMWQLEISAMVALIGCVTLPAGVLEKVSKGQVLSDEETQIYQMHPMVGSDLLSRIPRMEAVSDAIRYQNKHFDGGGEPIDRVQGAEIPLGARLLKVILDYDGCNGMKGLSPVQSLAVLQEQMQRYDPDILSALQRVVAMETPDATVDVSIAELCDGMIVNQDIKTQQGTLIICKGQEVTSAVRQRLEVFQVGDQLPNTIRVAVTFKDASQNSQSHNMISGLVQ